MVAEVSALGIYCEKGSVGQIKFNFVIFCVIALGLLSASTHPPTLLAPCGCEYWWLRQDEYPTGTRLEDRLIIRQDEYVNPIFGFFFYNCIFAFLSTIFPTFNSSIFDVLSLRD